MRSLEGKDPGARATFVAGTQMNLGNALKVLGERESRTTQLEEAIKAYREALQENTRSRVPHDWSMTQYNLGKVLLSLGERESGTVRLEEAVAAFREVSEGKNPRSGAARMGRYPSETWPCARYARDAGEWDSASPGGRCRFS